MTTPDLVAPTETHARELTGKVAIVTAAGKGIGRAVAEALLDGGASVVAASRTTPDIPTDHPERLVPLALDLTDPDAAPTATERAISQFGGIDILVNNLGGFPDGLRFRGFTSISAETFGRLWVHSRSYAREVRSLRLSGKLRSARASQEGDLSGSVRAH